MESLPERKHMRLPEYDYGANGAYFVTVCTEGKRCILGHVVGGGVLDAPSLHENASVNRRAVEDAGPYER